jgi:hypothetical protein
MPDESTLRRHIVNLLRGEHAYMPFETAVKNFPEEDINKFPPNVPYTFWHLVEHIRITQNDILDFSQNPDYVYLQWPQDYWPAKDAKATKKEWDESVESVIRDLDEMIGLIESPASDLFTPFAWGEGQNLLREAMVVANHNAYHIGEFGILRQVIGNWRDMP